MIETEINDSNFIEDMIDEVEEYNEHNSYLKP